MYDVYLGLHPYLRNGGRSRVEIKVEFREGVIPPSTLLALYGYHVVFCHLSVRCAYYPAILTFFVAQMGQILRETGCRRASYASGGSHNQSALIYKVQGT